MPLWSDGEGIRNMAMGELSGKVAVVTGASKGIGAAIARRFSDAGAAVAVNYSSDKDGADRLVESFARHLMRTIDHWRDAGFAAMANEYASLLERQEGVDYAIDENGDLLMTRAGKLVERRPLRPELAAPSWLDADGREPRT